MRPPIWMRALGAALLLALVFVGLRYWLALTPILSETYYDEALTGLMSLAILHGVPQVFYWGEAYGGADGDAYIAAAGFWLFGPSTLVLRMTAVMVAVVWAWAVAGLARRIVGEGGGLLAGLLVAVPPVFLSYVQLSSQGEGVALALGVVALACAACLVDAEALPWGRAVAWVLLGVAAGLGWWASQMTAMCLGAAGLGLIVARPKSLREPGLYAALGLFLVASLPFWIWNWRHEWITFRHLAGWGPPLPDWQTRIMITTRTLLESLQGGFWDRRAIHLTPAFRWLGLALIALVYAPAIGLAVLRLRLWGGRLLRRERPWQGAFDLVVLAFWLTVIAHLTTSFGAEGILRYAISFYAVLPVLCVVWLHRLWCRGRPGRIGAAALAILLLGYDFGTHVVFVKEAAGSPTRPVDAVIARMEALGLRTCYADNRVAQVITFESHERIMCTDFLGYRNFNLLAAVDAVDDPSAVAIVTHGVLRNPDPDTMAETLALMGADFKRDTAGHYVIFHHVRPPDLRLRPVAPAGWTARASTHAEEAVFAFDRRVWTRWTAPQARGEWLEVDLGRAHPVAQVTLEVGPFPRSDSPGGLRVETSLDGRAWDFAAQATHLLGGVHWWKGHPRVDDSGRVLVRMAPRLARYVRLTHLGPDRPGILWSVGELFVYEPADAEWDPGPAAREAHAAAAAALAPWMDDPWGPHPRRTPESFEHRRAQVAWASVYTAADRAVALAPEWDETHHLYGQALWLAGWSEAFDIEVERARADQAWIAVLHWVDEADSRHPELWRSGRAEARAEALKRLGRAKEAEAARRAAVPPPIPAVHARFDDKLELIGVALPAQARPGEAVRVRYAWQALQPMRATYSASVHVNGPDGVLIRDHRLGGDFGTLHWRPGERVEERLLLRIPADAPPGAYRVKVGVGRADTARPLTVRDADHPHDRHGVIVGTLIVEP
jgi:hypothetical protein